MTYGEDGKGKGGHRGYRASPYGEKGAYGEKGGSYGEKGGYGNYNQWNAGPTGPAPYQEGGEGYGFQPPQVDMIIAAPPVDGCAPRSHYAPERRWKGSKDQWGGKGDQWDWWGGKGGDSRRGRKNSSVKMCEEHGKMRAEDCLQEADNRLICKPEHQCRDAKEGQTAICFIHGKKRLTEVMVEDIDPSGNAGWRCSDEAPCKSKLGQAGNTLEQCSVHGKTRMQSALRWVDNAWKCSSGSQCK